MQERSRPDLRATEVLGAGDPGALEALFGRASEAGARLALAEAFRRFGFRAARLDPLGLRPPEAVPELDPARYGLAAEDAAPLRAAYCGAIGWEIGHVLDTARREWLAARAEEAWEPEPGALGRALDLIAAAEYLEEAFLRRLPGTKTFGLAGAEGYVVLTEAVLERAVRQGAWLVLVAGHHRGRFTQMALNFGKPLVRTIAEAAGTPPLPPDLGAHSDVPYHLGHEGVRAIAGARVELWVAPHPSHLSLVGPVMQGRARGLLRERERRDVLPLLLHTDAALAGQGINMEVMQLAGLAHYDIGGTIHLVLDNQIGFTTPPGEGRTARNATDIARLTEAPVLHVNGEDPAAILRVAEVAADYRARFGADVVVRLVAYRRRGHNEIDEPRFTQPVEYRAIDALPALSKRLAARLGREPAIEGFRAEVDGAFRAAKSWRPKAPPRPAGLGPAVEARLVRPVETGVPVERLRRLGGHMTGVPAGFALHPKVRQFLEKRAQAIDRGEEIDWATAEALALASLLDEGYAVRFSGQDTVRGAFSQRHLALFDQESGVRHEVLAGLGAPAEIFNTPLTENAVLAFEYGLSTAARDALVVWEAQFGDFLNVAQAVFDQIVTGGETRWLIESGLVILLPHGLEGGGPDHATGRPERLLAAAAEGNLRLVNASTPANYFHVLRRQLKDDLRKPLLVLTPKMLLRHPACVSRLADMGPGTHFRGVLPDAEVRGAARVVLCTGRLCYLLAAARRAAGRDDVAIVRVEQLYPLDAEALGRALDPHPGARLVWAEEEPANMGFFGALGPRLAAICGREVEHVSRPAMASPSEGPHAWEEAALRRVIAAALGEEG